MINFRILNAGNPQDVAVWLEAWKRGIDREIYAHPEFSILFSTPTMRAHCAWFQDDGGEALFPFTLRKISLEPWAVCPAECWDLTTPYGYGGPFRTGNPSAEAFWEEFSKWARESAVVSGFIRRSLFEDQLIDLPEPEQEIALNVVRTLQDPLETIWMDYEHKVRKNVNKAKRNGLVCRTDPEWEHLDDFCRIYQSTMDRRNASAFYFFDRHFFQKIRQNLTDQAMLFHTFDAEERIVSTELVLVSSRNIYSFLGGTLPEGYKCAANDLLKHTVIEWGHAQGKENFVLGGGFRSGDGIFLYKKAFASDGVKPFKVGNLIWDRVAYSELTTMRGIWERQNGREWQPAPQFFPTFRAPAHIQHASTEQP